MFQAWILTQNLYLNDVSVFSLLIGKGYDDRILNLFILSGLDLNLPVNKSNEYYKNYDLLVNREIFLPDEYDDEYAIMLDKPSLYKSSKLKDLIKNNCLNIIKTLPTYSLTRCQHISCNRLFCS